MKTRPSGSVLNVNETLAASMTRQLRTRVLDTQSHRVTHSVPNLCCIKRDVVFRRLMRWCQGFVAPGMMLDCGVYQPPGQGRRQRYYRQLYWRTQVVGDHIRWQLETLTLKALYPHFNEHILLLLSQHAQRRLYQRLNTIDHNEVLQELQVCVDQLHNILMVRLYAPTTHRWLLTSPRGVFVLLPLPFDSCETLLLTFISNRRLREGSRLRAVVLRAQREGHGLILNHPPYYPILSKQRLAAHLPTQRAAHELLNQILNEQYPGHLPAQERFQFWPIPEPINAADLPTRDRQAVWALIPPPQRIASRRPYRLRRSGLLDRELSDALLQRYAQAARIPMTKISRHVNPRMVYARHQPWL